MFKTYIATQGCLPNTITDFWNMIWQENTRVIVMTTKELERGKQKCAKYWPDQGQSKEWGHAKLTCISENSTNDYTLREFLFSWRNRDERHIYQYHFQVWPDHGVPSDPGCVLNFLHDVNACQEAIILSGITPVCDIFEYRPLTEPLLNILFCFACIFLGSYLRTLFSWHWPNRHIHSHWYDIGSNITQWPGYRNWHTTHHTNGPITTFGHGTNWSPVQIRLLCGTTLYTNIAHTDASRNAKFTNGTRIFEY